MNDDNLHNKIDSNKNILLMKCDIIVECAVKEDKKKEAKTQQNGRKTITGKT